MLADAKKAQLYGDFVRRIDVCQVRDAYTCIGGLAATLTESTCHPQQMDAVCDFRFMQGAEQPFAFTVNKREPMKFYFRAPASRSGRHTGRVAGRVPDASANNRGEWKVPLAFIDNRERLWRLLAVR